MPTMAAVTRRRVSGGRVAWTKTTCLDRERSIVGDGGGPWSEESG